jgi:hypothetical protein
VIEVERSTIIGNAKREADNIRKNVESRVIWTPSTLGTLVAWNEPSVKSNC